MKRDYETLPDEKGDPEWDKIIKQAEKDLDESSAPKKTQVGEEQGDKQKTDLC